MYRVLCSRVHFIYPPSAQRETRPDRPRVHDAHMRHGRAREPRTREYARPPPRPTSGERMHAPAWPEGVVCAKGWGGGGGAFRKERESTAMWRTVHRQTVRHIVSVHTWGRGGRVPVRGCESARSSHTCGLVSDRSDGADVNTPFCRGRSSHRLCLHVSRAREQGSRPQMTCEC